MPEFTTADADAYYLRNKAAFAAYKLDSDPLKEVIGDRCNFTHIVDIGGANGYRAKAIADWKGIKHNNIILIEPSKLAFEEANLPGLNTTFPLPNLHYNEEPDCIPLVICSYVLHWVARDRLMDALSQIDKLAGSSGYILINDFHVDSPHSRVYHHNKESGLRTYKSDYANMFRASHHWLFCNEKVYKVHDHEGIATMLHKDLSAAYQNEDDLF